MIETRDLISGDQPQSPTEETHLLQGPDRPVAKELAGRDRFKTYVLLFAILVLGNLSLQILLPAQTSIFEFVYCKSWYQEHDPNSVAPDGSIAEYLCKIPPIQSQVAFLKGWLQFFEDLPGLFLAIPVGVLADIYGRKWFLAVNLTSTLCRSLWTILVSFFGESVSLRFTWLSGLFNIVLCGGNIISESLVCSVITDITPPESLAGLFFRLTAVGYVCKMIGPAVAGYLMLKNNWWAILCSIILQFGMVALAFTMPETLNKARQVIELDEDGLNEEDQEDRGDHYNIAEGEDLLSKKLQDAIYGLRTVWSDYRLVFLAFLYPFRMMTQALGDLLNRYVSYRFHWSLAEATFLYSLQAFVSAILLLFILPPIVSYATRRFNLGPINGSVAVARVGLFVLSVAYFIEGFASTIPILIVGLLLESIGFGTSPLLRALAGAIVKQEDSAKVFTGLSVAKTLSNLAVYPLCATLLSVGMEKGGNWLGLPFDVSAVAYSFAGIFMLLLRFERGS